MFNIVLVEPEIPPNTGNIARLCVGADCPLYLVGKLGFSLSDKHLKRAGLDYWEHLNLFRYKSLEEFFDKYKNSRFVYVSKKAKLNFTNFEFRINDFLLFGKETKGLPEELIFSNPENSIRIPMSDKIRSINLSNSVAIVLYEALRQINFGNLDNSNQT